MTRLRPAAKEGARLGFWRKISLGSGDLAFNLYWQSSSLFLLYFYTDVLGISASVAGTIYMAALVWDATIDPVVGWVADRTRTRLGRYRPYLLFGAPILALAYAAMFLPPAMPDVTSLWLVTLTHLAFRTVYALVNIPYASLFARVTRDSAQRADLAGARILFAMIAGMLVSSTTLPLSGLLGGDDVRRGWQILGAIYGLFVMIILWHVAFVARGLDAPEPVSAVRHPTGTVWRSIVANRPLHLALGVVVLSSIASTFFHKNIIYYFKYVYGDTDAATVALTLSAATTAITVPLWTWVARTQGKRLAWASGTIVVAIGIVLWWFANGRGLAPLLVAIAVIASGMSANYICFWAVLPDTVEYGEWRTGVRTESLVFGLVVLGQKAALGIAAGALGVALNAIGYQPNEDMSEATAHGLRMMMLSIPLLGAGLSLLLVLNYRLSYAQHSQIVQDIEDRARVAEQQGTAG
jgi:GPH family glycoside/pentoside/hexuronide:cation symporter